jgi:hypothetical protein
LVSWRYKRSSLYSEAYIVGGAQAAIGGGKVMQYFRWLAHDFDIESAK